MREQGRRDSNRNQRPTLRTIAFMTGLGVTTVSRALKDAPDISEATKERVRLVAKQIGYIPNRAGVRLRTGKTNVISFALDLEEDLLGHTDKIVSGITSVLADTQYNLTITPYRHDRDPLEPIHQILDTGAADGIIMARTVPDDARVRLLAERNFPFATHGRTDMGIIHPYHDFDNAAFVYKSVEKLASLGRQRIALFAPPKYMSYGVHSLEGFQRALETFAVEEVPFDDVHVDSPIEATFEAARKLMMGDNPPDGFVALSASGAMAITAGLEAAGYKLGREVDVTAKQFLEVMNWFRPELITSMEDVKAAGVALAHAILARIEGADPATLQTIAQPGEFQDHSPHGP